MNITRKTDKEKMATTPNIGSPLTFPRLGSPGATPAWNPWGKKTEDAGSMKTPPVQTPSIGKAAPTAVSDKKVDAPSVPKEKKKTKKKSKRGKFAKNPVELVEEPEIGQRRRRKLPPLKEANADGLTEEGKERLDALVAEVNAGRGNVKKACSDSSVRIARQSLSCSVAEALLISEAAAAANKGLSEYIRWLFFDHAKIAKRPHPEKRVPRLVALAWGSFDRKNMNPGR